MNFRNTSRSLVRPLGVTLGLAFILCAVSLLGAPRGCAQAGPCPAGAAPDQKTSGSRFKQGDAVVAVMDESLDAGMRGQVSGSLTAWNNLNSQNGSGVYFYDYYAPLEGAGGSGYVADPTTITYRAGTLYNSDGSVDTATAARFSVTSNYADGTIHTATLTFNTGGAMAQPGDASQGVPPDPSAGPFYNPNLAGYDTIFQKETGHEIGHGMGLADQNAGQNGASIMNGAVANCPNDSCGRKPLNPTPCDSSVVAQEPQYHVFYDGGGGGGGGEYYGDYYGGYCTPYYWVYYESWDGGKTWDIVDVSYAGCW